jgi:hypothetical protein
VILGMVGRAGSGKDTIADLLVYHHGFVKVALADPLKRICRDVYGFTDDQLWGSSSARNAPDSRYPRPSLPYLPEEGHVTAPKPVREGTALFACVNCGSEINIEDTAAFDAWESQRCGPDHLTPRHALQRLGTEWGRACYENTWIDLALRTARVLLDGWHAYSPLHGLIQRYSPSIRGIVLSDIRFPNEVHAIRAAGGRLWRTTHGEGLSGVAGMHESERYVDALEVDGVVPDSPIEALPEIVATMLKEVLR